jgi:hypothetical protein
LVRAVFIGTDYNYAYSEAMRGVFVDNALDPSLRDIRPIEPPSNSTPLVTTTHSIVSRQHVVPKLHGRRFKILHVLDVNRSYFNRISKRNSITCSSETT